MKKAMSREIMFEILFFIDRDLISEKENEIIVLSHQLPDKYLNQKSNISWKMFPLI